MRRADFAYLVQEEGASVGYLEQPFLLGVRPVNELFLVSGKSSDSMKVFVDRRAVDGLESFAGARAGLVYGAGDALFCRCRIRRGSAPLN